MNMEWRWFSRVFGTFDIELLILIGGVVGMNVLVIGSGGREHALAWKSAQSDAVETVFVAPGNAGTAVEPGCENVDIAVGEFAALANFAADHHVELTIVGPEVPLVDGVCDFFAARGLACFGPSSRAARLEGSKSFTKEFLARHDIPTAAYETFTDVNAAKAYILREGAPIVIKADGLAAGKGVTVAETMDEARQALRNCMEADAFGAAGRTVVLEQRLRGQEVSLFVLTDGTHAATFLPAQDHKRLGDGDTGPNTGGLLRHSLSTHVPHGVDGTTIRSSRRATAAALHGHA